MPLMMAPVKSQEKFWKYLTAMMLLLLIGSIVLNFFLFQQSTNYKSQYETLRAAKEKQATENIPPPAVISTPPEGVDPLSDPAFKWTSIQGYGAYQGSELAIGWNESTREVYLQAKVMPDPPAGKQFQLWAIVNKKLVNAGIFNTGAANAQQLQQMKTVAAAQGFAITLEKQGGSAEPSMSQVCMSAKINR